MDCQTTCILNSLTFKDQNGTPQRPAASRLKIYARQDGRLYTIGPDGTVLPVGTGDGTITSIAAETSDPNLSITGSPVTGSGTFTFALQGITAFVRTIFNDPDAATVRTTLGLVIGSDVQAHSADLDAFVANASYSGSTLVTGGGIQIGGAAQVMGNLQVDVNATITGNLLCIADATVQGTLTTENLVVNTLGNFLAAINVDGNAAFNGTIDAIGGTITFGTSNPIITFGSGVPGFAADDGSLYLRGGSPNGSIFVRRNATWINTTMVPDTGWVASPGGETKGGLGNGPADFDGTMEADINAVSAGAGSAILEIQNQLGACMAVTVALQNALRNRLTPNA